MSEVFNISTFRGFYIIMPPRRNLPWIDYGGLANLNLVSRHWQCVPSKRRKTAHWCVFHHMVAPAGFLWLDPLAVIALQHLCITLISLLFGAKLSYHYATALNYIHYLQHVDKYSVGVIADSLGGNHESGE